MKRPATSSGTPARPSTANGPPAADANGAGPSTHTLQKRHSHSNFTTADTTSAAPPRPPRNPARTSDPKPKKSRRPSTATGTREEVTPWEFFPVNTPTEALQTMTADESAKQASATATGKREDVLPWELFPAPHYDDPPDATNPVPVINGHGSGSSTQPNHTHTRQTRSSTSSSMLSFQDIALLRRRKSTGTKGVHPPSRPPVAYGAPPPIGSPRASTSTAASNKSPAASPKVLHKVPSNATVRPRMPHESFSGPVPTLATVSPDSDSSTPTPSFAAPPALASGASHGTAHDPKFSTADRTILQELRRNIDARAAQFVVKGGPGESTLMRLGARHHAYAREDVPYPRSYAREVLDLDVWETMACQKICDSLTWHVFPTPPTKVLDIGCGTGTWILNCGMAWRDCHFVGMDIVPLHPDLGASELSTRITWVQANFLEGLPFEADEFDFVHIKRIALGVPEDKWDGLFEEIARVLKSGGAFELIEEDLFFPGKTSDEEGDSDSDVTSEVRYARARRDSATTDGEHEDDESVITGTGSGGSRVSYDGSAPTPNTSLGAIPATPPRTASPLPMLGALIREEVIEETAEEGGAGNGPSPAAKKSAAASPHRHSYQGRAPMFMSPASSRTASMSATSLLGLGVAVSPPIASMPSMVMRGAKQRGYSTSTLVSSSTQQPPASSSQITATGTTKPQTFAPFLLRTLPKAPPNPRDHSLLEGIYNEMNATRFINLSPLSLLANLVGLHFKDVRTHPPLQLTFPPPVAKAPPEVASTDDESDSDDARNAIIPSPRRRQSIMSASTSGLSTSPNSPRSATTFGDDSTIATIAEERRWVNTDDLLKRESRYITLDDSRMSAFSPSNRSSFPAMSPVRSISGLPAVDPPVPSGAIPSAGGDGHANGKQPVRTSEQKTRLPNATFNIDVRSLNMHLALRTAEILACAESMWEWVVSYQARVQVERAAGRPRAGSLASEVSPGASRLLALPRDPAADAFKSAILDLTREDFDGLLVKFELDMRDHMAIGSTLRDQFSWPCMQIAPSQDRKAFNAACERWEHWQSAQRPKESPLRRHQTRNSIDTVYDGDRHPIRGGTSLPQTSSRHKRTSSSIPPDRRLSRSFRVFVAWKP